MPVVCGGHCFHLSHRWSVFLFLLLTPPPCHAMPCSHPVAFFSFFFSFLSSPCTLPFPSSSTASAFCGLCDLATCAQDYKYGSGAACSSFSSSFLLSCCFSTALSRPLHPTRADGFALAFAPFLPRPSCTRTTPSPTLPLPALLPRRRHVYCKPRPPQPSLDRF